MYQWLLLDADDTLFDYDRAEAFALKSAFAAFDLPFRPEYAQAYRRINTQIWRDFEQGKISQKRLRTQRFERLFAAVQARADAHAFSKSYLQSLGQSGYLLDGAQEVVRALHSRLKLALITNGLQEVQRSRLARSGIEGYFSAVVISEEVGAAKPASAIFDAAFARIGQPPKAAVLIVGDSLSSDMQGGSDYGIDTCWFNPGRAVCDRPLRITYQISQLSELLDIVAG